MSRISPFRIVLIFMTLSALAGLVLPHIRLNLIPAEGDHGFTVIFSHWNSSPDVVEDQVTSVLENAFSKVRGLNKISSTSGYSYGQIKLDFPKNTDLSTKQFELISIIRQIYPRLPAGTSYPVLIPSREEDGESRTPVLIYSVKAPEQPFLIRQTVEEIIGEKLSGTPGLQDVSLTGTEPLQIVIRFDSHLCQSLHITPAGIGNALQSYFAETYPGVIERDGREYFIRINAPPAGISAIEQIIISAGNPPIRIKDVAKVSLEEEDAHSYFRIDGENAINLILFTRKNDNAILVADRLEQRIKILSSRLPASYRISLSYDETAFLRKEIDKNYKRGLLSICILSIFIFLAYRSWRYLLILSGTLLVNISITILLAYLFKIDIHIYTIAGIAIVFGIMMDNAIIVLDYCHRSYGREIFPALLSATATTIAALCLIFFLPDGEKRNLYDFSLIIIVGLISSLIIALIFIPGLYQLVFGTGLYYEKQKPARRRKNLRQLKYRNIYWRTIGFMAKYRPVLIVLVILLFGTPIFLLPSNMEGKNWQHQLYNATLGSREYEKKIRPYVDNFLGGTLHAFAKGSQKRYGYRSVEKTKLYIGAELPVGSTLGQMNGVMTSLDRYIKNIKGIDTYVTNVYSGQYGTIEITFKEEVERSSLPYRVRSKIIGYSQDLGGVEFNINGVGEGFGSGMEEEETPSFTLVMKGYNYDELQRQANLLKDKLSIQERVEKINIDDRLDLNERKGKEYMLDLDEDRMALLHTDKFSVLNGLQKMAMPLSSSATLLLNDRFYPVYLQEKKSSSYSSFDLLNNYMMQDSARIVRLNEVGSIQLHTTAGTIHKEDRQYIRNVSFSFIGSYQRGNEFLDQTLKDMKLQLPVGFSVKKAVMKDEHENALQPYMLIVLLLASIFFICGILFESLKRPFCIIATIPVSFIGVFLVFSVGKFYFDQGGYAAFVLLGGLVANASIFIVNDVIRLQKRNKGDANYVMIKAVFDRGRTVLLTNLATCCGLIPYLPGGNQEIFWFSFAIGALGGLIFSLFPLFFFLPVLLWKKKVPVQRRDRAKAFSSGAAN